MESETTHLSEMTDDHDRAQARVDLLDKLADLAHETAKRLKSDADRIGELLAKANTSTRNVEHLQRIELLREAREWVEVARRCVESTADCE